MIETNTYKKFKNSKQDNYPTKIIVHHSASPHTQSVEVIENYHLSLGWEGVGYHYLITWEGEVWKGRPEHYHGAHCKGQNNNSIGICLIGNFSQETPSNAQIDALRGLLDDICSRYSISKIEPHRAYANKDCYGTNLADDWASKLLDSSLTEIESKLDNLSKEELVVLLRKIIDKLV